MSSENLEDLLNEFVILQNSHKSPFKDPRINDMLKKLYVSRSQDKLSIQVRKEFKDEVVFEDSKSVSEYSEDFLEFKSFILRTFEDDLVTVDSVDLQTQYKKKTGSKIGDINALDRAFNEKQSISSFERDKYPFDPNFPSKTDEPSSYLHTPNETLNTAGTPKPDRPKEAPKKSVHGEPSTGKKVLPGGRYGLSIFVKYFGSQKLQSLSLGRILALIKKALSMGLLEHVKVRVTRASSSRATCSSRSKPHWTSSSARC